MQQRMKLFTYLRRVYVSGPCKHIYDLFSPARHPHWCPTQVEAHMLICYGAHRLILQQDVSQRETIQSIKWRRV